MGRRGPRRPTPATGYVLLVSFSFKNNGTPSIAGKIYNGIIIKVATESGIGPKILSPTVPMMIPPKIEPAQNFIKNQLILIPLLHFMQDQLNQSGEGKTNKYHNRTAFLWQ